MDHHITEAEWQIMRAIWDQAPATSKTLIAEMQTQMAWEPTTVKTLLARLVKKGALAYEAKGRTFYYSPLVTEEACVRNEMQAVVEKVYGGVLNLETEHFYFKGQWDVVIMPKLAETLEKYCSKVFDHLLYVPTHKILVYSHETQKRLHSALGLIEGPDWLRGGCLWGIIHLAPNRYFTELPQDMAAVHLLTQMIISEINPQVPYWLLQMVSVYEGQWLTSERIKKVVREHKEIVSLSHFEHMANSYLLFKDTGGYELAYTVGAFMHQNFGYEKIAAFIRKPYAFIEVLGCSEATFWNQWRAFVDQNYA